MRRRKARRIDILAISREAIETVANGIRTSENMIENDQTGEYGFFERVAQNLERNGLMIPAVVNRFDTVEKRLFEEYGAVFLTKAVPPPKLMFENEAQVSSFQSSAGISRETMNGAEIELQPLAMESLKAARDDAQKSGLRISPRDGAEAGRRTYEDTVRLWNSRFEPALVHWKSKNRLDDPAIERLKSLGIKQQVSAVLELEKEGIFFNTFFDNSILFSVAAPGTSQHLSMLAFDVDEFADPAIQSIMGEHGWFRTVQNDAPHFTFLGFSESDLTTIGLKKVTKKDGAFWIPDL